MLTAEHAPEELLAQLFNPIGRHTTEPSPKSWIKTARYEDNMVEGTMGARYESMVTSPLNRVIQHLLADFGPDGGGMTDGELLARFLSSRDDSALAALVRRHAPMVWGVCCRLLHHHHDAEDAFQATFLVLVRKAAAVPRQAVANWLYGVARQTAVRVRRTAAKRGRRETQVVNMPEPTVAQVRGADLQAVLDEELGRLPDHYRGVIVLCDLEGMTRKEAARQLGIPEGSVASRLARARVLLAKRLTQRGVVFSGGSAAAVLSAGSASASAPPALVASTIKAASLLATGQAAGVVSAKVAALAEGMVKAMFVTKLKSVLGLALVIATLVAVAGQIYQTHAAGVPEAKEEQLFAKQDQKKGDEKQPAQPKQPAKTDEERILGNWFIVNEDSGRKGEMWVISKDRILMHAKNLGKSPGTNSYKIDAGKTPKHIDINQHVIGFSTGPSRGIFAFDGDELRICLPALGKERPTEFASKPAVSGLLILHRQEQGAEQPKAKAGPPDAKKVLTPEEAVKLMPKENVTVQFKVASVEVTGWYLGYPATYYVHLKDGGKFTAWLRGLHPVNQEDQILKLVKKLGIESVTDLSGKVVRVTGRVDESGLRMFVHDPANNIEVVKPKTDGKEQKPNEEKQPLTKEEKLRALIDQVLAAHGGEDKLNKLTSFTITVKEGYTQHYFVQPPKSFRWESTHQDQTGKRIVILFPEGRRWWTKEPNEDAKEFRPTGIEPLSAHGWFDYVKFFGPRQVLRLKDQGHKVALLDEEAKIAGRAAVGVQVTGPHYNHKMYFDKETHLLLKGVGSGILREVTFSDYKKFDGIPIARKEHDGHSESLVTDFRVVDNLDAKLFEQP